MCLDMFQGTALPLRCDGRFKIPPPHRLYSDSRPACFAFLCLRVVFSDLQRNVALGPADAKVRLFIIFKMGVGCEPSEETADESPLVFFLAWSSHGHISDDSLLHTHSDATIRVWFSFLAQDQPF